MLHAPRRLERLYAWPRPDVRPDLQVVFIDEDGDRARSETLRPFVGSPFVAGVLAVAVPEFEGWLIADPQTVSRASGHTFQQPPDVETMRRREPRRRLDDHQTEEPDERRHAVRLEIAKCLDLDHVAKACSSFGRFVRDLEEAVTRIPRR